jgi:hypothetical protein
VPESSRSIARGYPVVDPVLPKQSHRQTFREYLGRELVISPNLPVLPTGLALSVKGLFSGMFFSYSNDAITLASHAQGLYQSPKYGKFIEPPEK